MKGALTGVTRLSSKAKCAILLLGLWSWDSSFFQWRAWIKTRIPSIQTARVAQTVQQERRLHRPSPRLKKCSGKRSRARRKEDQRQQSAIRAALEMRAGQSGASASNVEALRESSDLNPLR